MERLIMFIIIGITQVHGNQIEDDVFITNKTSYNDISQSCRLFGSTLPENVSYQNITLNVSYDGPLWIGAKGVFKRQIKPIAIKESCGSNENDGISIYECSKKCKGSKFFYHNGNYCKCVTNDIKEQSIQNVEINEAIMRQTNIDCVIYGRVNGFEETTCDTLTRNNYKWSFGSEICNEKKNYRYICVKDDKIEENQDGLLTWKEAYIKCKSKGQDLIQSTKPFWNEYRNKTSTSNTTTFWVDFFGILEFSWGTAAEDEACVAASISLNRRMSLAPVSCKEQMPALCYKGEGLERTNGKTLHNAGTPMFYLTAICLLVGFCYLCRLT